VAEKQLFPSIPKFHAFIDKQMKKLGINVRYDEKVLKIENDVIYTERGEYPSEFIVICIGSQPIVIDSDLEFYGAYKVDRFCQVQGLEGIYSIGDASNFPYVEGSAPILAQVAKIQANYLVNSLIRKVKGKRVKPLRLKPIRFMSVSLGKNYGVAAFLNRYITRGFIAWLLERTYYMYDLFRYKKDFRLFKSYGISTLFHNYYFRIEHELL
jgi:NADH dehydrogenase